ncbi:hypothetical protein HanPI659440_Chr11g0415751 [Helianthus annuus]|nr:hypothetical protein HanPI659440_Chr11g0415751 [Helianthus annuus]
MFFFLYLHLDHFIYYFWGVTFKYHVEERIKIKVKEQIAKKKKKKKKKSICVFLCFVL